MSSPKNAPELNEAFSDSSVSAPELWDTVFNGSKRLVWARNFYFREHEVYFPALICVVQKSGQFAQVPWPFPEDDMFLIEYICCPKENPPVPQHTALLKKDVKPIYVSADAQDQSVINMEK
jgi:hypothetical protein